MIKFHEIIRENKRLILDQCLKAEKMLQTEDYGDDDVCVYIDEKETIVISQVDNYKIFESTSERVFVCTICYNHMDVNQTFYLEELKKQLKTDLGIVIDFGNNRHLDELMVISGIFDLSDTSTQESFENARDRTVENLFYSKTMAEYALQIEQRIIDIEYCYKQQSKKEAK